MAKKDSPLMGTGVSFMDGTRDIFKDGPSPELEERWDLMDKAIDDYPNCTIKEKQELLNKYPSIKFEVMCPECGRDYE